MKSKQLEEIKNLHNRLSSIGLGSEPSLEHHVSIALCSGEVPRLKPAVTISNTARRRIIGDRYSNRELKFADVFSSTNGYNKEMKQWNAYQLKRKVALAKFEKDAEKIMVKAMDSDSEASEIVEELHAAADRSGIKSMQAPIFDQSE